MQLTCELLLGIKESEDVAQPRHPGKVVESECYISPVTWIISLNLVCIDPCGQMTD